MEDITKIKLAVVVIALLQVGNILISIINSESKPQESKVYNQIIINKDEYIDEDEEETTEI